MQAPAFEGSFWGGNVGVYAPSETAMPPPAPIGTHILLTNASRAILSMELSAASSPMVTSVETAAYVGAR